jgi:hypothetical protein
LIGPSPVLDCAIDTKVTSEENSEEKEVTNYQQNVCEPCSTANTQSPSVSRCEATWLMMILFVGAVCAYGWQCLQTVKTKFNNVIWNLLKDQLFYWSTLCWDTLAVFTVKSKKEQSSVPRRIMRKAQHQARRFKPLYGSLFFCAYIWLVFTDSVHVSRTSYNGAYPVHPFKEVRQRLTGTYQRIQHLDKTMDLTPVTFMEWKRLQCK